MKLNESPPVVRLVRECECASLTGLSRTTRWRLERHGKFPMRRRISDNAVGWLESELLDWVQSREPVGTSRDT